MLEHCIKLLHVDQTTFYIHVHNNEYRNRLLRHLIWFLLLLRYYTYGGSLSASAPYKNRHAHVKHTKGTATHKRSVSMQENCVKI